MNEQQHRTLIAAAMAKGSHDVHVPPRRKAVLAHISAFTGLYISPGMAQEVYAAYLCARQYEGLWQAFMA